MSVINQMLKDLDQRKQDQLADDQHGHKVVGATKKAKKMWIIVALITTILSILIYSGYLLQQNKKLYQLVKRQHEQKQSKQGQNIQPHKKPHTTLEKHTKIMPVTLVKTKSSQGLTSHVVVANTVKKRLSNQQNKADKLTSKEVTLSSAQTVVAPSLTAQTDIIVPTKPSMSVTRRRISATQLAKQKMSLAQEAVLTNKLVEAEKLFEEILILTPRNQAARKQLAALWFGRKAFQNALNLLSQGMILDPDNSEYPLMQARIYLSQGDNEKAYGILKAFEQNNNIEYLSTLANVAQQLKKFAEAVNTYKHLTNLQPSESRWWLGLGVAYDSSRQYVLAVAAYHTAITRGKLSNSTLLFAKQRIQALKE